MPTTVLQIAPSLAEPGKRLVDAGELLNLFQFVFDELSKLGSTDVVPSTRKVAVVVPASTVVAAAAAAKEDESEARPAPARTTTQARGGR